MFTGLVVNGEGRLLWVYDETVAAAGSGPWDRTA